MSRDPGHDEVREALGTYTLGALDPSERAQVESHLADCPQCRDELARFAGLPGLLSRLSADEAAAGLVAGAGSAERAVALVARYQAATRRRLRRWQLLAAAAVAALTLVTAAGILGDMRPGAGVVLEPTAVAADAAGTVGSLRVHSRDWGMEVDVELDRLPERVGYALVAVTGNDHRAQVASWTATDAGTVRLKGSCYVSPDELVRLEVVDPEGELLVAFDV